MENKERYLRALVKNKGKWNEIDLGEEIGLNEEETREIIVCLLSENKIKYAEMTVCKYSPVKAIKHILKK